MPEKATQRRAQRDKAEGKSASTQAGEFVREEVHHVREGKHGARSPKQLIAIGLSKARRAGVALPPPEPGKTSKETRRKAKSDAARGRRGPGASRRPPAAGAARRSRATRNALRHEGQSAASEGSLARQARSAAAQRSPSARRAASRKAVRTKGPSRRKAAAKKAARTRAAHSS
jgi:hypothetical protein